MTSSTAVTVAGVERHPVLGGIAGFLIGVGAALLLFVYGVLPLTAGWFLALALLGAVLGVVGALSIPAMRGPRPQPARSTRGPSS